MALASRARRLISRLLLEHDDRQFQQSVNPTLSLLVQGRRFALEGGSDVGELPLPRFRWELWSSWRLPFCIPPSARSPLRRNTGALSPRHATIACSGTPMLRRLALLLRLSTPSRNNRVPGTPVLRRPSGYGSPPNLVRGVQRKDFS
jgi:hypothetical protein